MDHVAFKSSGLVLVFSIRLTSSATTLGTAYWPLIHVLTVRSPTSISRAKALWQTSVPLIF